MKKQNQKMCRRNKGFTLVELILVVLILSVAALIAIPAFSSAADVQVRSTANRIAADLDYARGLAITRQQNYAVVFDPATESYEICVPEGAAIKNPLDGKDFIVDLTADSRVGGVNIVSVNCTDNAITFNYLGTPYAGNDAGLTTPLNSEGVILVRSKNGGFELNVKVEPMTGYVTVE